MGGFIYLMTILESSVKAVSALKAMLRWLMSLLIQGEVKEALDRARMEWFAFVVVSVVCVDICSSGYLTP